MTPENVASANYKNEIDVIFCGIRMFSFAARSSAPGSQVKTTEIKA